MKTKEELSLQTILDCQLLWYIEMEWPIMIVYGIMWV